jgi:hypothetical protein
MKSVGVIKCVAVLLPVIALALFWLKKDDGKILALEVGMAENSEPRERPEPVSPLNLGNEDVLEFEGEVSRMGKIWRYAVDDSFLRKINKMLVSERREWHGSREGLNLTSVNDSFDYLCNNIVLNFIPAKYAENADAFYWGRKIR